MEKGKEGDREKGKQAGRQVIWLTRKSPIETGVGGEMVTRVY